jgi:hypothetical protein
MAGRLSAAEAAGDGMRGSEVRRFWKMRRSGRSFLRRSEVIEGRTQGGILVE